MFIMILFMWSADWWDTSIEYNSIKFIYGKNVHGKVYLIYLVTCTLLIFDVFTNYRY